MFILFLRRRLMLCMYLITKIEIYYVQLEARYRDLVPFFTTKFMIDP